jgi:hypothetical protein
MITWVHPMIQRPIRYVHDRGNPKVLEEDLMTLQQPGILPCTFETCHCNTTPFVASGFYAIARGYLKNRHHQGGITTWTDFLQSISIV